MRVGIARELAGCGKLCCCLCTIDVCLIDGMGNDNCLYDRDSYGFWGRKTGWLVVLVEFWIMNLIVDEFAYLSRCVIQFVLFCCERRGGGISTHLLAGCFPHQESCEWRHTGAKNGGREHTILAD